MTSIEYIGIGIAVLSPIYAALWYLIILGTKNKERVIEVQKDVSELKSRFDNCRYCSSGSK